MGKFAIVAMLVTGCSAATSTPVAATGPSAQDQETALEIVWEGIYGMERESRPASITWWPSDGCHEELNATGISAADTCASDSEGSKGDIYVRWEGSLSASSFSRALVMWRQYLTTGAMTRPSVDDFGLIDSAQSELSLAGL